ncbi:MAG TPA: hypothetical protein VGE59_02560 [Patescibacteria group bacterium]
MSLAYLFGLIILMGLLSNWLSKALATMAPYSIFRLALLPGIILHESAHVAGCWLTGARVHRVHFWTQSGGEVIHTQPKIPVIGPPIISFAPFVVGMYALWHLGIYLTVPPLEISWQRGLAVFLMMSIGATLIPSKQDFKNSFGSLVVIAILASAALYFFPSLWHPLNTYAQPLLKPFILVTAIIATLTFLANLTMWRR